MDGITAGATVIINIATILIPVLVALRSIDKRVTTVETKTRRGCPDKPTCPLND